MLAYIFWHAPADGVGGEDYESDQLAFQRSLARTPPYGFHGSASFIIEALPWGSPGERSRELAPAALAFGFARPAYEDWYLVEDFTALGVLNEAAVGRGHRTSHDRAARGAGAGTAAIYRLLEGEVTAAEPVAAAPHATWVGGSGSPNRREELGAFLGDGLDQQGSSLWQRQLVLGPAPEFCLLSRERPAGASPTRLAPSWSSVTLSRERVW